jgi:hypothetical protein
MIALLTVGLVTLGVVPGSPAPATPLPEALAVADTRVAALRGLLDGDARALAAVRADAEPTRAALRGLAGDEEATLEARVLAVRALALIGLADEDARALSSLLEVGDAPEGVAIGREAARALRQASRRDALSPGVSSVDPEIRALAAGGGAGGADALCALLRADAWPDVRVAAATGLRAHPEAAGCLADGLGSELPRLQTAAAATAAHLATGEGDGSLTDALARLAGNARAPVPARSQALVALGRLGALAPARAIFETHLAKGGIEPLVAGALHGAGSAPPDDTVWPLVERLAESSESASVRVQAAEALHRAGRAGAEAAIDAAGRKAPAHHRSRFDALRSGGTAQGAELGDVVPEPGADPDL